MAESQNIEWKESWWDEYLKWICGFANAQGGKSTSISYKGVYHYRSGSTKQVLTGPALESFLNGKRGVT